MASTLLISRSAIEQGKHFVWIDDIGALALYRDQTDSTVERQLRKGDDHGTYSLSCSDSLVNWCGAIMALQQKLGLLAQRRYRYYSPDCADSFVARKNLETLSADSGLSHRIKEELSMQRCLCLALFMIVCALSTQGQTPSVKPEDFAPLLGGPWIGTLTYRDYSSNKEVSIASNLKVIRATENNRAWIFEYEYPKEPKANSKETVVISEDGTSVNDEKVVAQESLAGGVLRLVTERAGDDNDQDALIRHIYLISNSSFSSTKEVRPQGSTKFFERNRYSWRR